MHLIPRNEGEPFGIHGKKMAPAERLADHASRLAAVFSPVS
jgi:hypothetical protein